MFKNRNRGLAKIESVYNRKLTNNKVHVNLSSIQSKSNTTSKSKAKSRRDGGIADGFGGDGELQIEEGEESRRRVWRLQVLCV